MDFSLIDPVAISRLLLVILLHFVWQATLICLTIVVIRALIHPRHVQVRYATSVVGLLMLVVASLATTGYYVLIDTSISSLHPVEESAMALAVPNVESGTIWETFESQFLVVFGWFDANRSLWLGIWTLGVLVLIGRLAGSLIYCFQLRRSRIALPPHLERLASDIKSKLNLTRDIVVASSQKVSQAVATGIIKPVVLIPVSWVSELPLSAIEAVLAHELAHVKRWDLWVNLLQRLTETVFFFHPLVWWLSRTISSEREICCDQLAIRATGKPMKYVETLAQIATATTADNLEIQLGTAFKGGKNMKLLRRARMILEPSSIDPGSPFRALTLVVCVAMLVSLGSYAYCSYPAAVQEDDDELIQRIELLVDDIEQQQDLDELHESHDLHVELMHEGDVDRRAIARKLRELADQLESGGQLRVRGRLHQSDDGNHERMRLRARLHELEDEKKHHEHRLQLRYHEHDADVEKKRHEHRLQLRHHEHDADVEKKAYRFRLHEHAHEHEGDEKERHEYRLRLRDDANNNEIHGEHRRRLHSIDENVELELHSGHEIRDLIVGRELDAAAGQIVGDEKRRIVRLRGAELKDRKANERLDLLHAGDLLLRDANIRADVALAEGGRLLVDGDRPIRGGTIVDGDRRVRGGIVVDRERVSRRGVVRDGVWRQERERAGETSEEGMKEALRDLRNQVEHLRHELHELKSNRNDRVRESGRILLERTVDPKRAPMNLMYRLEEPKVKDQTMELDLKVRPELKTGDIRVLSEIPRIGLLFERSSNRVIEKLKDPERREGTLLKIRERIIDPEGTERNVEEWLHRDKGGKLLELKVEPEIRGGALKEAIKDINVEWTGESDIDIELIEKEEADK